MACARARRADPPAAAGPGRPRPRGPALAAPGRPRPPGPAPPGLAVDARRLAAVRHHRARAATALTGDSAGRELREQGVPGRILGALDVVPVVKHHGDDLAGGIE